MAKKEDSPISAKLVIDGLPSNAFRVVGVGSDVIIESFYLYPDFAKAADGQQVQFSMEPDPDSEPNIRLICSREVGARLALALCASLGIQVTAQPNEEGKTTEVSTAE